MSAPPTNSGRRVTRREALRGLAALTLGAAVGSRAGRAEAAAEKPALYVNDRLETSAIRGVNYLPGYAASPYQAWWNYQPAAIRKDLKLAHELGFNSARIFLSFTAYEGQPSLFLKNFTDFMAAARDEGITILPVLFDAWGTELDPFYQTDFLAKSEDSGKRRSEPARVAFNRYITRPDAYGIDAGLYQKRLKYICLSLTPEREIPISRDPGAPFWGEWAPAPATKRLGGRDKSKYEDYIKSVMEPYKDDPFVALWDVMNEPDASGLFGKRPDPMPHYEFANWALKIARGVGAMQPITVGASGGYAGARVFAPKEDVVSLHVFASQFPNLGTAAKEAAKHGKPVLVGAAAAMMFPANALEASPETQERLVREAVQQAERERSGYYLWHLIEGKGLTPWAALLNADGSPRPAMTWLKDHWAGH